MFFSQILSFKSNNCFVLLFSFVSIEIGIIDFLYPWQIAERRKLVSSIKSSITDLDEEEDSREQRDNSLPNVDLASSSFDMIDEGKNGSISSSSHVNSTMNSEILPSDEAGKEPERHLPSEKANHNLGSTKQLKTTDSKAFKSDVLPSYLLSSIDTAQRATEENENLTKAGLYDVDGADDPAIEGEKPPPLAGANAMNVILVAAECAPWIKTGNIPLPDNRR